MRHIGEEFRFGLIGIALFLQCPRSEPWDGLRSERGMRRLSEGIRRKVMPRATTAIKKANDWKKKASHTRSEGNCGKVK